MHELNTALAAKLALVLGEAAVYDPADNCPQGHSNLDPECGGFERKAGELCIFCVFKAPGWNSGNLKQGYTAHLNDAAWHPEWRIERGEPKDFTEPAILIPAVKAWAALDVERRGFSIDFSMGSTDVCVFDENGQYWSTAIDPMLALAQALLGAFGDGDAYAREPL